MITAERSKVDTNNPKEKTYNSNPAKQVKPPHLPTKTEYSVNAEIITVSNIQEKPKD